MTQVQVIPEPILGFNLLSEIRHLLYDGRDGGYEHLHYSYGRESLLFINAGVRINDRDISIFTRRDYPNICFVGEDWKLELNWGGVPETIECPRPETFEGSPSACLNDLFLLRLHL